MRIDLILKDIQDPQARENFDRLVKFVGKQQILDGDWKFFEIDIGTGNTNLSFKHNLSFVPIDVILLNSVGDQNFRFKYQQFDRDNIYVEANGPVVLRFLAGRYPSYATGIQRNYPFVPNTGGGSASSECAMVKRKVRVVVDAVLRILVDNCLHISAYDGPSSGLDINKTIEINSGGAMTVLANSRATVGV
jgi:hypothetical protein